MSEFPASRSLLLEQLESRCLLAGGLFAFSPGHNQRSDQRGDRSPDQDRPRNDHPAEVRGVEITPGNRSARPMHQVAERMRRDGPPTERPALPANQPPRSLGPQPGRQAGSSGTFNSDATFRILQVSGAGNSALENSSDQSSFVPQQRRNPQPLPLALPRVDSTVTSTVDAASIASRVDPSSGGSPTNLALPGGSLIDDSGTVATVQPGRSALDPGVSSEVSFGWADHEAENHERGEFRTGDDEYGAFTPRSKLESQGMIESFPLLRGLLRSAEPTQLEQPWELDDESLSRLHDVAVQTASQRAGSADATIASWFEGPGGLIDLGTATGPLIAADAADDVVHVVLDVTFGLHRSLDLVGSEEPFATSQILRDAIFAAMAGEQVVSGNPVPATNLFSAFAYSGAAMVAGTLVIARRRHASASLATGNHHRGVAKSGT